MTIRFHSTSIIALGAALSLAACGGDSGGSPTASTVPAGANVTTCTARITLDLQPGQTAPLTGEQAACFALTPHAGARYAAAGFDARSIESARTGPEAYLSGDAVYKVDDGSGTTPLTSAANLDRSAGPRAPVDFRAEATADPASPFARATPWGVGDRIPVRRVDTGATVSARVTKVMGGRYVFALVDADQEGHTNRFMSDTEKGMDFLLREGVGLLNRTWGSGEPSTSAGSGQVLVVYAGWNPDQGAGTASTFAATDGSGVGTFIWLNLNVRPGVRDGYDMLDVPSYRLKVLAHELTHAWQMRYAYTSQPAGPRSVSFGPAWAMEGTADLLSMDLVRRSLGISLTSNWGWENRLRGSNDAIAYALQPADTRGRLSRGYYDAASFLQDVQVRMARHGVSADDALLQVARGAVEGWFGVDGAGVRRAGLATRVQAVLGAAWEPADAVLLWTLTQAADDQGDSPELNNPVYASTSDNENPNAWKSAIDEVQVGRGFAYQVTRANGSSFFVRLKDDGKGGTVSLSANVDGARWMIARVR